MKKIKSILILTFCFALLLTTTTVPSDYEIEPYGHIDYDASKK